MVSFDLVPLCDFRTISSIYWGSSVGLCGAWRLGTILASYRLTPTDCFFRRRGACVRDFTTAPCRTVSPPLLVNFEIKHQTVYLLERSSSPACSLVQRRLVQSFSPPCIFPQMVILERRKNASIAGTLPVIRLRKRIVSVDDKKVPVPSLDAERNVVAFDEYGQQKLLEPNKVPLESRLRFCFFLVGLCFYTIFFHKKHHDTRPDPK